MAMRNHKKQKVLIVLIRLPVIGLLLFFFCEYGRSPVHAFLYSIRKLELHIYDSV